MRGQHEGSLKTARGLARAALHLSASGKTSALNLARQAVAMNAEPETLGAYCRVATALYDINTLEDAVALAEPYADSSAELAALINELRAGPLAVIALARRLPAREPLAITPTPGRILYILHKSLPHATDGYATRSHGLAQAMLARGADLVCLTRPGFPHDLDTNGGRALPDNAIETVDGVHYNRLASPMRSAFPPPPFECMAHASIEYLTRSAARLVEAIRHHRPACVVAASNSTTALPACLAAHQLGIPFVYEVRGFWEISRMASDPDYLLTAMGRQERYLEIATAQAAQAVITLTGPMRDELIARGVEPARIAVVPNGCDPERFAPKPRNRALAERLALAAETPVIGYVGSFNAYEGLDILVQACAALKREGLQFRLLLVGSEPPDSAGNQPVTGEINRMAAEQGLGDWLIMPGRVPHDTVADWYSLIDIAPFPRKSLPVTQLVSPLKPLEAMAMAKAVVASSVGGMQEIVTDGHNGLVVPSDNAPALAEALRALLHNETQRRQLGAAAREWVRDERGWEQSAMTINLITQSLMLRNKHSKNHHF